MFVITGGGSGIGRALALSLSARGEKVLIVGRRLEALLETQKLAANIQFCQADVSTIEGQSRIVAMLNQQPLKGLIHNAGILGPVVPLKEMTLSAWREVQATNVDAPLFLTQALLSQLTHGRVLNISSGAAHFAAKGWSAYCVSKAALTQLTRCWQADYPSMSFSSVMPGVVDTSILDIVMAGPAVMDVEKVEFFRILKREDRILTPDCVGSFLTWLLCETTPAEFSSKEWDIYDTTHHPLWLKSPHRVSSLEANA